MKEAGEVKIDTKAEQEDKNIIAQAKRDRREQNALHWAFVVMIWVACIGISLLIGIRISHLFLPPKYAWLDDARLSKIDQFFTNSAIGGAVVGFFKGRLSKPRE